MLAINWHTQSIMPIHNSSEIHSCSHINVMDENEYNIKKHTRESDKKRY